MELGVLLRVQLLHRTEGIERAEDKNRRARVERPFHRIGNDTLRGLIGDADPGKENRKEVTYHRSGVTERGLNCIGCTLLLLVDHIAHHHLEGLHGDVDTRIKEHEAEQAEPHRGVQAEEDRLRECEVSGVREQQHYRDRDERAHE